MNDRYYVDGRGKSPYGEATKMYHASDFDDAYKQAKKDFWFVRRIRHYPTRLE